MKRTVYFICGRAYKAERVASCTPSGKYVNFTFQANNRI